MLGYSNFKGSTFLLSCLEKSVSVSFLLFFPVLGVVGHRGFTIVLNFSEHTPAGKLNLCTGLAGGHSFSSFFGPLVHMIFLEKYRRELEGVSQRGGENIYFLRRFSSVLRRVLEGKKASKKPPETF